MRVPRKNNGLLISIGLVLSLFALAVIMASMRGRKKKSVMSALRTLLGCMDAVNNECARALVIVRLKVMIGEVLLYRWVDHKGRTKQ